MTAYDPPPPPAPDPPPSPAPADPYGGKVDFELAEDLEVAPEERHRVAVWFRDVPGLPVLAELGLVETTDNPAVGFVDRHQIATLAGREDVERINLRPQSFLH